MYYRDRRHAGLELASHLRDLEGRPDVLVLGIPRGGVVVAHQVALAVNAPLDAYLARKLGAPGNPELAIGAISADGSMVVDDALARSVGADVAYIRAEAQRQRREIERRLARYRGESPPLTVKDKIAVLVDDGVATGATTLAAARALKTEQPSQLILAVPVASQEAVGRLSAEVDRFVCPLIPDFFWAVGAFYANFAQTTDDEVIQLLHDPALPGRVDSGAGGFPSDERIP